MYNQPPIPKTELLLKKLIIMLWSYTTGSLVLKINRFVPLLSKKCNKEAKKENWTSLFQCNSTSADNLSGTKIFFSFHCSLPLTLFAMTNNIFLQ